MKKVFGFVILSAVLFSTMEVALKIASVGLDPFQMTFIRFFWGGIFLLPFAIKELKKRSIVFDRNDFYYYMILGILNIVISMTFFQLGVIYAKASTAAVVFCTNPMFTMLFAHFITEEKLTKKKVVALGISIIGLLFIMNPFNMNAGDELIGIGLAFVSAVVFGLYSAYGKLRIKKYGGIAQTSISFIMGSLVLLVFLWVTRRPVISGITQDNLLLVVYISILVTGVGYLAYFMAMEKSNALYASLVFFVKPAIAPVFAILILCETITINVIIGIVFILIGSYITMGAGRLIKKS
ncbi:MAG: DMT family transporter [Clostridia bacterium]|nr:DMT family transporter [Clostridia bacterium]